MKFVEIPLDQKFFSKVYPEPNTGCWLWSGYCDRAGYGILQIDYVKKFAHRISYQMHKGDIPLGLGVLHTCDNKFCVNPDHLYAGTHLQNMHDLITRGNPRRKLTLENVMEIKNGLPIKEAMIKFNVKYQVIMNVIKNKTWRHIKI